MRRRLTASPKVFGSSHDAVAEQMMPNTVHVYAGGKRVLLVCDPFAELFSTTLVRIQLWRGPVHGSAQETARDRVTELMSVSPHCDSSVLREVHVFGCVYLR